MRNSTRNSGWSLVGVKHSTAPYLLMNRHITYNVYWDKAIVELVLIGERYLHGYYTLGPRVTKKGHNTSVLMYIQ